MAKIAGFVQKIFGKNATNIGQVGSAAAGTKVLTSNTATIQALAAFENGISDVTLTSKRIIPQEEFMALHFLHTLQNAYTQQEGIHEYNSGVTYFTNSIVKKAGTYELYGSLVDDNIGNALTDVTKWKFLTDLSGLVMTFAGASNAEGTSGYIQFPNGFIVQGGHFSNTTPSGTILTFPIPFPTACKLVVGIDDGGTCKSVGVNSSPSKSSCTLYQRDPTAAGAQVGGGIFWLACGI